ncbi:hypothetical protein CDUR_04125 [Corynebacterium durum]|nr:hypothetical protein [Corynebacterium durum]WJY84576.1 hypothetical protein CDUR_04125 [Corynebacterium durum]
MLGGSRGGMRPKRNSFVVTYETYVTCYVVDIKHAVKCF